MKSWFDWQGVTQLEDSVGYGLINTINILANTKEYRSNPLQISEEVWRNSNELNLESQCIPHCLLLSVSLTSQYDV